MTIISKVLLVLLAWIILVVIGSCIPGPASGVVLQEFPSKIYRAYSPPTRTSACVDVVWVEDLIESGNLCGTLGAKGCRIKTAEGNEVIVAQKPHSFNDNWALQILGHEFLHVLGADHE